MIIVANAHTLHLEAISLMQFCSGVHVCAPSQDKQRQAPYTRGHLLRMGGEAMCRTGERVEDWPGANRGVGDMEKKSSSQDDGQGLPDVEIATGRQAASRGTAVMRGDIK